MKVFLTVIITAVVTLGGVWGVRWYLKKHDPSKDAAEVRVERIVSGDLTEVVNAPGQIQPRTKVSISARVPARIIALPYLEGQKVTGPDNPTTQPSVLVKLESKEFDAQLRQAEAQRAAQAAQAGVSKARVSSKKATTRAMSISLVDAGRDFERQLKLREKGDISLAIVEQAQTKRDNLSAQLAALNEDLKSEEANLVVLGHQLEAADAEIARTRDALTYTTITSPIDGIVTRVNAKVGELVVTGTMNNPGTVIMEVADLDVMLAVAKLDETTIAGVRIGQKAIVHIQAYPDELFEGVVDTVALAHTEERDGTKYYKTEILLRTDGRRIPSGLSADVDIEIKAHQDVIKVPSQAVLGRAVDELPTGIRDLPEVDKTKTTTTVVYRVIDGKAVVTPVKIGPSDVTHTIVRSGLKVDDVVIVGPYKVLENVKHDQMVKATESAVSRPAASRPTTTRSTRQD